MFDIKPYLWPDDPWAKERPDEVARIYDEKHRIANLLQPSSVLEIGVRAGYSGAVFLSCGAKHYIGLDATDTYGGTPGAVDYARHSLPTHFPDVSIAIHHVNTQAVSHLSYGPVDLVHVDGDHSLEGCLHDLELALALRPKWILVDDILHHPESCNIAAHYFASRHRLRHIFIPTLRGDILFQVNV